MLGAVRLGSQGEVDVHADVAEQWRALAVLACGAARRAVKHLPELGLAGVEHNPDILEPVDLQQPLHGV